MTSRVIAIDGPAGSGKSTTAKAVARRLGLAHLDSGALYRAATLAALDAGAEMSGTAIVALAKSLPVRLDLTDDGFRPEVAGVDVSTEIRTDRVTERVSEVSALPELRVWANEELRSAAASHPRGVVMDGRDIGTVVFPDAAVKVFLVANGEERARRRLLQMGLSTDSGSVRKKTEDMAERDRKDSSRAVAPLTQADGAVLVDTTNLDFEEQVDRVVEMGRKAFS
ncbi:MAG: (d)CMP kinase [Gemmatimonadota bacterium]|nr:MAG: (d)CMP kinase [Gemmatimonadota bacterium]